MKIVYSTVASPALAKLTNAIFACPLSCWYRLSPQRLFLSRRRWYGMQKFWPLLISSLVYSRRCFWQQAKSNIHHGEMVPFGAYGVYLHHHERRCRSWLFIWSWEDWGDPVYRCRYFVVWRMTIGCLALVQVFINDLQLTCLFQSVIIFIIIA